EPSFRFIRADQFQAAEGESWTVGSSAFSRGRPGGRWMWSARRESELIATEPVILPGPFDSVELWAGWETAGSESLSGFAAVSLIARDAEGIRHEWPMGSLRAGSWMVLHHQLPWRAAETSAFPFRVEAVRVSAEASARPITSAPGAEPAHGILHLEHLSAYTEDRSPVVPAWGPGNIRFQPPMRAVIHGRPDYWSPEERLFPMGSDGRSVLVRERDGHVRWECEAKGRGWAYRVDPERWWTEGVEFLEKIQDRWRSRGSWRGLDLPASPLIAHRMDAESLHLCREDGWAASIRVHRGALVMELSRETRDPVVLRAGGFDAPAGVYQMALPWFNDQGQGPPMALLLPNDSASAPWIASVGFDPRGSSASALDYQEFQDGHPVGWMTAKYFAGPDGRAPAPRERLVLHVTPDLREALPALSPPPEGIRSPSLWLSADPEIASIQRSELERQGWPVNMAVDPAFLGTVEAGTADELDPISVIRHAVRRTSDGQWARSPNGAPAVKWPVLAAALEEEPHEHPEALAYALASQNPEDAVDYDPRSLEDAGQRAGPYRAVAECLTRARAAVGTGPAGWSAVPAPMAWVYAGRADAAWSSGAEASRAARRPEFVLCSLAQAMRPAVPVTDDALSGQAVLALLGAPVLGAVTDRVAMARSAAMGSVLVPALRDRARVQVGYYAEEGLLAFTEAALRGEREADRLYVEFEGPVELCLNLSPDTDWPARLGGQIWRLPPGGWVVESLDVKAAMARDDRGRLEFIRAPGRVFWNSDPGVEAEGIESNAPFIAYALGRERGWDIRLLREGTGRRLRWPLPTGALGAVAQAGDTTDIPVTVTKDRLSVELDIPDDVEELELRWTRP
ncbi:MAG: hypothetical protein KBA51_09555, partial [Kiritimatiellae bacterium]|nr:hypothetical protein [Kiritimatiellia bacterium]